VTDGLQFKFIVKSLQDLIATSTTIIEDRKNGRAVLQYETTQNMRLCSLYSPPKMHETFLVTRLLRMIIYVLATEKGKTVKLSL
jgi:hypothetical protein